MIQFTRTSYLPNISLDDAVGILPHFWDAADPRKAIEQHDSHNPPGGPWHLPSMIQWDYDRVTEKLQYGDPNEEDADPPYWPLAYAILPLSRERIVVYPNAWVAIVQDDGTFVVDRRD